MSDTTARRLLIPFTIAVLLAYYLYFVWPGLRLYFDNDDMMNLYFAWSKPLMSSYRPLGALFYRTMFALAGFHPLPFRIVCVMLGALNMGLCYWFARLASRSHRIACLAVLLFAFHTRLMEVWYRTAVVYDLLCFTFFYLAACLYMSRPKLSVARGIAVVACFVLALEAKEVAVVLPVILLVWTVMQQLTEEEVERRAWGAFKYNLPALVEAYKAKFGTEIGTENAREIVSAEYAESIEARTRWSRASPRDLRGHSSGVGSREPEPKRPGAPGSAKAQPDGLDVSLAVPLLCGLIDIPYLWFKTHGAQALTNVVDYQPQYTFTRFAHTWALYLNYLFVLKDQILPWVALAILAGLLLAALRSKKLLFAWTLLFVPVLPVAFLEYRGAFVLYTSYPGWTLYLATALVMLQDLIKTHRTALACAVFALVAWRFGKLNLHDQRADPRTWLHQSPEQVRQMAEAMPVLAPRLRTGAHVLFVKDPFSTDEWTPYFIMKLLYRDDTLVPDRVRMMAVPPDSWDRYDFVFTYENGQYRRLSTIAGERQK